MMTYRQRHLLGYELCRLGAALKNGRYDDRELAPRVERVWRGVRELCADVCNASARKPTPLEYTLDKITQAVALFDGERPAHIGRGCLD